MDDWQLLNEFATAHSEGAFRALVERHAVLVYQVALRDLGDHPSAQ